MAVTLDSLLKRTWFQEILPGQRRHWLTQLDVDQLPSQSVSLLIRAYADCMLDQRHYVPDVKAVEELRAGRALVINGTTVSGAQLATFLNALVLAEFGADEFLEMPFTLRERRLEQDSRELGIQKEEYRRILIWWAGDNRRQLLRV